MTAPGEDQNRQFRPLESPAGKVLDNLRYIDGLGRGIPLIIRAMEKAAVWTEEGELLRLTLFLG